VSLTVSEPLRGRALFDRIWKFTLRRVVLPIVVWGPIAYVFPKIALFYLACGIYDVSRNRPLKASTIRRYFLGNGVLLWMLSPINVLLDLFSLPYVNKGIYRLEDFPADMQREIRRFMQVTNEAGLVQKSEEAVQKHKRAMIFWRSYGVKIDAPVNVPAYDEHWKYIKTIGLSVFNKKTTTSWHFGWLRPTMRSCLSSPRTGFWSTPASTMASPAPRRRRNFRKLLPARASARRPLRFGLETGV